MSQTDNDYRPYQTKRAYRLGVANGVLFTIGGAFVDPATVLPSFISQLTDSAVAVGLISAIGSGGWYLPQLFVASYAQPRPRKRPLYIFSAFLRAAGWFIAIPAVYLLCPRQAALGLVGFFLGYSLFAFGGGLGGIAFLDIVAKTVAPNRLGSFFGNRQFWGAVGGIGAGFLVRAVLANRAIPFPGNYCLIMVIALASFLPGWFAYSLVREPPGRPGQAQPLLHFLSSIPRLVSQDREYALLLSSRLLLGGTGIALPFYILYCRESLGVPQSGVGTYLAIQMTGSVLAIPLWAHLNDRRGPRTLLVASGLLSLAIPALALSASLIPFPPSLRQLAFGLVFFTLAAAGAGQFMGFTNYLLGLAPEEQRPLYIGVLNTLYAVTTFLPIVAGFVVRFGSFQLLFAIATLLGLAGLVTVLKLPRSSPADP